MPGAVSTTLYLDPFGTNSAILHLNSRRGASEQGVRSDRIHLILSCEQDRSSDTVEKHPDLGQSGFVGAIGDDPGTPVAGPRLVPLIAIIRPGASRVLSFRAAFSTVRMTAGVGAETTRVTVIACGGFDALAPVTVTVPVCVPGASPVGFAVIDRLVAGVPAAPVVPEAGATVSQFPVEAATALKLIAVPELVKPTVWAAGAGDPCV